jgi:hypothetical protein
MGRSNNATLRSVWAWLISLGLHGILLGGFALVRLPTAGRDVREGRGAVVSLEAVRRVIEAEPVVPKPTLRPILSDNAEANLSWRSMPEVPADLPVSGEAVDLSEELIHPSGTFFGGPLAAERICFVTDCSGSMFGRMGLVRAQLEQAIENLASNQFFSVLFFREGETILESGSGFLVRAGRESKQKALELVESIRPVGPTAALPALRRAMELRTPGGQGAELIYFLTDGFDLDDAGAARFVREVLGMRKKLAPQTVIHTIGFWTDPGDRRILEILAAQTGGIFIPVESVEEESNETL